MEKVAIKASTQAREITSIDQMGKIGGVKSSQKSDIHRQENRFEWHCKRCVESYRVYGKMGKGTGSFEQKFKNEIEQRKHWPCLFLFIFRNGALQKLWSRIGKWMWNGERRDSIFLLSPSMENEERKLFFKTIHTGNIFRRFAL